MDISALLDTTTPLSDKNNEAAMQLPPNIEEASTQSSQDANEVSGQSSLDIDMPMEMEPTMTDPSENGYSTPAEFPQPSEFTGGTSEGVGGEKGTEDEDDDMDSELSEGEDLQDDLQEALDDQHFSFTGTFYHASLLTTAPNPCLHISGLGPVGLPLSDRDAKSIISCANQAPFGHGELTLVDKIVRDTWEIEPAKVTFLNPHWEPYVKSTVIHEVCKSLGVTIGNHPPKLELYKLLLYEQGSHFLPHQDTQKADGMFATVIIVLPSPYAGGEVVVSHASTTKTIDFAQSSLLSTAVLAWYTDVKHEVKEVTAGYRLALSYNLIHCVPSGSIPRAGLPNLDDAVVPLRQALAKWKAGKYNNGLDRNLIAYLLDHEYSSVDLHVGLNALKGVDAHRVKFLRPVAEELGLKVGLASLEQHVTGEADDCGGGYYQRGRYDDHDEYSGTPGMLEVTDSMTKISDLVDLDGKVLVSTGDIPLDQDELIPKDPFEGKKPDDTDYEGYTGNEAGQLEYWYHRTVFVIIPNEKIDDILYSVEGIPYAFRKLKESNANSPSAADRQWVNRLIVKDGHRLTKEHIVSLVDYALKWRDLATWKDLMKLRTCSLQVVDVDKLLKAWELFSFEAVRVSFEELLARSTQLPERMKFIFDIRSKASAEDGHVALPWCQKESDKILSSYTTATVGDVPTIMSVISVAGLQSFKRIVLPNLLNKNDNFDFWIAFIKALREDRETILEGEAEPSRFPKLTPAATAQAGAPTDNLTDGQAQTSDEGPQAQGAYMVGLLIKECLQAAASRWSNIPPPPPIYHYYGRLPQNGHKTDKVNRIIQVIEEAITISDLEVYRNLFSEIIKMDGQMTNKFDEVYIPLIPRLRSLLTRMQLGIYTPPFVDLFQVLIGLYLKEVLVDKAHKDTRLRKLGCGCEDCNRLDTFILDLKSSATIFWMAQARQTHLEDRLMNASDLCKFTTIQRGSPHGLEITKHPKVVQASTWEGRQKAAKAFLKSIGPDTVIAQIMGARYLEVQRAIEGVLPFGWVKNNIVATPSAETSCVSQSATASSSSAQFAVPRTSTTAPASQPALSQVAGKKRKNVIQLGPVIDLTENE